MASQITSVTIVYSTVRSAQIKENIRVIGLCVGNSVVTGKFPAQMAINAENISIWWRHHDVDTQWYQVISRLSDGYILPRCNRA